jgi:hypothetical protein
MLTEKTRVADPVPNYFEGLDLRIRIRVNSCIQIRIKVKIQEV